MQQQVCSCLSGYLQQHSVKCYSWQQNMHSIYRTAALHQACSAWHAFWVQTSTKQLKLRWHCYPDSAVKQLRCCFASHKATSGGCMLRQHVSMQGKCPLHKAAATGRLSMLTALCWLCKQTSNCRITKSVPCHSLCITWSNNVASEQQHF